MSRNCSVAPLPNRSSASRAWRIEPIIWRRKTASNACAAWRSCSALRVGRASAGGGAGLRGETGRSQDHQLGAQRAGLLERLEDRDQVGRRGADRVHRPDDLGRARRRARSSNIGARSSLDLDVAVVLDRGLAAREAARAGLTRGFSCDARR